MVVVRGRGLLEDVKKLPYLIPQLDLTQLFRYGYLRIPHQCHKSILPYLPAHINAHTPTSPRMHRLVSSRRDKQEIANLK